MKFIEKTSNNIPVTIIKTNKFKSIYVSVYFKSPVTKENVTYRSVLKDILITSSMKYKKQSELYINLLDNYDSYLSSSSSRYGNYIINSFRTSTLDDKYTEEGNLDKVINTFCEVLFNPYIKDNKFDLDTFNMVISKRKSELKKILEESSTLSLYKTYKALNQNKAYTYFSELKYLDELTPEILYDEYLKMMSSSEINIIVCGNINGNESFIEKITSNFKNSVKQNVPLIINNDDIKDEYKMVEESGIGTQNIIDIVMPIKNYTDYELNYVAPLYRVILGGMDSSRLFVKIREENSFSYYVFARLEKDDSMINVIMGLEKENYKKALDMSLVIINGMKNITDTELANAKKEVVTALLESQDNISNVVSRCYNEKLFNLPKLDFFIEKINNVTKKEVEDFSLKVKPILSHFLKGDNIYE